ncbi:hypothetical protein B0T24DRAFT_666507 [Lasiosphaeria ovina]|uniref:Uncharacterized protein n=1 Tax=Lasiosphaeria ovina TaxID=92902 RepID=A0AAE0KB39_9PEZI|nr:hypothetical protein B0T24DRAFT_666507 [Lasiosphaeria ovina]
MNYANMIDEKRLKNGFIIATLISTIAGTFTTGINLFDRIADKRKQGKLDHGQDQKIKELEQRIASAESGNGRPRPGNRGSDNDSDAGNEQLRNSLQHGGASVQREFDQHYAQIGPRFAQGDLVAQTQIQGQIIVLQSTVIKMLQEALATGQPPDISRLYNASEFAREGSIRALRDQYRRMLQPAAAVAVRRPIGPVRRTSSTPTLRDNNAPYPYPAALSVSSHQSSTTTTRGPPARALTRFDQNGPLFCRFAEHLQHRSRSHADMDSLYGGGGGGGCPVCGAELGVLDGSPGTGSQAWRIEKEVVVERERRTARGSPHRSADYSHGHGSGVGTETIEDVVVTRTFVLTDRFLAKCHRAGAGYACYLCFRHRERDTLCKGDEGLVSHVSNQHSISEYEGDPDIKEAPRALTY